ncbi:MAG: DUF370 domain-containing protein [Oscillospiraceae bacterium]|nr:DUF370 domain-containing protein [Oscillospiraceae bacterium]
MFVQASKNRFLRQRDIVGVFDLDTSTISAVTKNFLSGAEKNGRTVGITKLPKSFVLAAFKKRKETIYFSASMTSHIQKQRLSTGSTQNLGINGDCKNFKSRRNLISK